MSKKKIAGLVFLAVLVVSCGYAIQRTPTKVLKASYDEKIKQEKKFCIECHNSSGTGRLHQQKYDEAENRENSAGRHIFPDLDQHIEPHLKAEINKRCVTCHKPSNQDAINVCKYIGGSYKEPTKLIHEATCAGEGCHSGSDQNLHPIHKRFGFKPKPGEIAMEVDLKFRRSRDKPKPLYTFWPDVFGCLSCHSMHKTKGDMTLVGRRLAKFEIKKNASIYCYECHTIQATKCSMAECHTRDQGIQKRFHDRRNMHPQMLVGPVQEMAEQAFPSWPQHKKECLICHAGFTNHDGQEKKDDYMKGCGQGDCHKALKAAKKKYRFGNKGVDFLQVMQKDMFERGKVWLEYPVEPIKK